MKQLAVPSSLPAALAALDRALDEAGASALDPAVPAALWRRALAEPAAEFLARPGKELRTSIVRAGWALAGGDGAMPERLPLPIELLHAGSLIVDDVEDASDKRRGAPALHHLVGVPLAINTGSWMYFWALAELSELGLEPRAELAVLRAANATLVRCHQGQALDLATRIAYVDVVDAPAVVAAITRLKTGALCRFAAELGARAAGAAPDALAAIVRFAEAMGTGLQMLDDLGSLVSPARRDKGHEDLTLGRATWPWAWLAEQGPFAWSRFVAMERAVIAGDGSIDALADTLAGAVGDTGRARVRAALDGALDDLVRVVGPGRAVDTIAGELRRMEASYG